MNVRAPRWTAHYRIQFAYPEYAGEGMTLDVSHDGFCMITGRPIAPGEQIYARLMFSDDGPGCIECHMATVIWSRDRKVGLKISLIEECERQRFVLLLHQLATAAQTRFNSPVNADAINPIDLLTL